MLAAVACGYRSPTSPSGEGGATINGTVAGTTSSTVSVAGTTLSSSVDAAGTFQLAGVPTGDVQLVFGSGGTPPTVSLSNVADQEMIELQVAIVGGTATIEREVRGNAAVSPVEIKKHTNGQHADQAPGPTIPIGNPVVWTYVVTNKGAHPFTSLSVTDDRGVTVLCPTTLPGPGASITCTGSGTAEAGQYRNVGTVTVTANGARRYTASDVGYYFGVPVSGVSIKKFTNGRDVDQAPGPSIPIGSPIAWTYVVTNTSAFTFTSLSVTDDRGVAVLCPTTTLPGPGASITCTGSGTAVAGPYRNVGTVVATANGNRYTDSDASYYFGVPAAGVSIKKFTNGQDVDQAPGPSIPVGSPIAWTYVVTNTGASTFTSLSVTDDRGVAVFCPTTLPGPGASITCTGSGTAVAGQYPQCRNSRRHRQR